MNFEIFRWRDFEINIRLNSPKFYCGLFVAVSAFYLLYMQGLLMRAGCTFFVFVLLGALEIHCDEKITLGLNCLWMLGATFVLMFLPQYILKLNFKYIKISILLLGFLFTMTVLLFWFIWTRSSRASMIISFTLLLGLALINYYVFSFRGKELTPADIFAVGTAMNVAVKYDYSLNISVVTFLVFSVLYCFCGFSIPNLKVKWKKWNSIGMIAAEILMILVFSIGLKGIEPKHDFRTNEIRRHGFYVSFLSKFNETKVVEPEGYSLQILDELDEKYFMVSEEAAKTEKKPDIIMIMGESFGDLRVTGELRTDLEVMPFYDSLQENTIKGRALSSAFGGGTCNSELEVLTGFTMSNLSSNAFPYQQYIGDTTWSMAHYLRSQGYTTLATHPENQMNWRRYAVYPFLGFEDIRFEESYVGKEKVCGHISDQEMYEHIITWYEEKKGDSPLFFFGVTMQNHSPYDEEDLEVKVHLEGYSMEYPEVEHYLTLTQMSDQALKYLVEYFESVENDVVLVFFGDHMPKLEGFYEEQQGASINTLQGEIAQKTVPFFIWTNYDIEEQTVAYTSLNYLSNFIYEAAGIELPVYNKFLKDVQEKIPAISSAGYYSVEKGAFAGLDEMTEAEKELVTKYSILQYNGLFDAENHNEKIFPIQTVDVDE